MPGSGTRLAWAETRLCRGRAPLLFSAAGATAALYVHGPGARARGRSDSAPEPGGARRSSPRRAELPAAETAPAPQLVSRPKLQRPHRTLSPQESYAAELYLLQRAQSDYASQDFPDALVLVAEHARRFPNGRLAEEREALRVRSLAGAGRGDQARRALAAFAKRFPRSVLLPRLREQARAAE